jgi:glycosyltransferase involved in cell wall biosynthesis
MNLLYCSYWGINDPLTHSTIFPNIEILSSFPDIDSIYLATIERNPYTAKTDFASSKVNHIPLLSKYQNVKLFNKWFDFNVLPKQIQNICKQKNIDVILARGAMIGAIAAKAKSKNVKLIIESFEPHADYMAESGSWKKSGLKYKTQLQFEVLEKQTADFLITVSEKYKELLIEKDKLEDSKVYTIPCYTDLEKFKFSVTTREEIRKQLAIQPKEIVGIYVGKFGDIYYDTEAFQIFKIAFETIPQFKLIILTGDKHEAIQLKLKMVGVDLSKVIIKTVLHNEVNNYLCAADFGFATIKPAPSKRYCSPVKMGEYWACGLAVLLTQGIGDDSKIIKKEGGGEVFNYSKPSIEKAIKEVLNQIQQPNNRELNRKLAEKYKSPEIAIKTYKKIFSHT